MDENDRQEGIEHVDQEPTPTEPSVEASEAPSYHRSMDFMNPEAPEPGTEPSSEQAAADEVSLASTEIEPETSATPTGQSYTTPEAQTTSQHVTTDERPISPLATPATGLSTAKPRDKKRLLIMTAAGLLLLATIGLGTWWLLAGNKKTETSRQNSSTSSEPFEQPKLGVAVTVADGTVEFRRGEGEWQPVATNTQLKESDFVRTGEDSRAVLTLDDGSAIRLDATTTVELVSLTADKIEIKQVDGMVYSRVVPSERKYTVLLDGSTYEAMGTAFATSKDLTRSGIQVFQSSVRVNNLPEYVVKEGKQLYQPFGDFMGPLEITDIDLDALADDTFINWNLAEDEKDATFKTRLGILPEVRQRAEELKKERQAAEEKRQAEKAAAEKAANEKRELEDKKKQTAAAGAKVARGKMALSAGSGNSLSWNYTGKALYGYKLIYSKTNNSPKFGIDESVYYADSSVTTGHLPSGDKIGAGRYRVAVCAYTNNTEEEPCVDYSNVVYLNL